MNSRWQTRSAKPVITSISVMLIVLVVLAFFPQRFTSTLVLRQCRKRQRDTYRLILTLSGNYRRFYCERNSLTALHSIIILDCNSRDGPGCISRWEEGIALSSLMVHHVFLMLFNNMLRHPIFITMIKLSFTKSYLNFN